MLHAADPDVSGFRKPSNEYRPMPFWHLNGPLNKDTIIRQMYRAKHEARFGGISILPVSSMSPAYLRRGLFRTFIGDNVGVFRAATAWS